jgi:NADH dehydrogenase [ubiquinone] 1 alpha subcomplex assembly factor 5
MGESNAILGRRAGISRDVLIAAEAIYKGMSKRGRRGGETDGLSIDMYGKEDGSVPATFQVIFMVN